MFTRRQMLVGAAVLPLAGVALADDTPQARNRRMLFQRLRLAATEREGRRAEDAVWRMWMDAAPTPEVAEAVAEAMRRRERYDWDQALEILNGVAAAAPGYAEGWNQRAFIRFLKQDFDGALEDIERALALEPLHFAALAGRATILMQQGRIGPGQTALRRAVEIHPWLKERSMLIPPPGEVPPGEEKEI